MTTDVAPAWIPTGRTLAANEAIIGRGIEGFIETGIALTDVRETGQYREAGFDSFSAYLAERWPQTSRAQAYRAIGAAHIVGLLSPIGDGPANEAQARELAPLRDDPGALRDVWHQVRAGHGDDLTAADIREAVQEHRAPDEEDGTAPQAPTEDLGRIPATRLRSIYRTEAAAMRRLMETNPKRLAYVIGIDGKTQQALKFVASARSWLDAFEQGLNG